jgi:hypothetical protein
MHLPDDPDLERARRIVAARTMMRSKPPSTFVGLQLGDLERVQRKGKDQKHQMIAHGILAINLMCAEHHPELLGYRRAGRFSGHSLSTVKRAWSRFAPVSHLLLAGSFNPHDGEQDEREWFLQYLAYAEAVRLLGESVFAHGQAAGSPLLNPDETWKCPSAIVLPSADVSFPPLNERMLTKLRNVRV